MIEQLLASIEHHEEAVVVLAFAVAIVVSALGKAIAKAVAARNEHSNRVLDAIVVGDRYRKEQQR